MAGPSKITILCVDDDEDFLELTQSLLVEEGYEVLIADGVNTGFEVIKQNADRLAIVVSDFNMGDGNGFDLRKKMLNDCKEIPFVILSAYIDREMALEGLEYKIAAFADKPYQSDELKNLIDKESGDRIQFLEEAAELKISFLEEATEIIEELEPVLVSIEDGKIGSDSFDLVFRLVHTLKGSSGVLGIPEFTAFLHVYEDLIGSLRNGQALDYDGAIALMMLAFDKVSESLEQVQAGGGDKLDFGEIHLQIKNISDQVNKGISSGNSRKLGNPDAGSDRSEKKKDESKNNSILVPTKMLDEFMVHSGEITVIRNMIKKLVVAIEKKLPADTDVGLLADLLENMHKINSNIQAQIVDQRKQAVFSFVKRYPRTIRELSRQLDKPASLTIMGSDLRVDPKIATTLAKSLIHLVRNSIDHGIESREDRKKSGKGIEGKITLNFYEEGGNTIVTLKDDGGGIDVEKIRAKLVEKEMFTEKQLDRMKKSAILGQIFSAGFSTAEKVTDVSGRGVGMDMVKSSIEEVGGKIELDSEIGVGTTVRLIVPIPKSVTIINALLVKVAGQIYSIPQDSIFRLLRVSANNYDIHFKTFEGTEVLDFAGSLIPLVKLDQYLDLAKSAEGIDIACYQDHNIVVLSNDYGHVAVLVDEIIDAEDIVVKELFSGIAKIGPYKGATFLGDGSVGLILDADVIMEHAQDEHIHTLENDSEIDIAHQKKGLVREELLVFTTGSNGRVWGVNLSDVYRFEEIEMDMIQNSGEWPVVNYRDSITPILDFEKIHL